MTVTSRLTVTDLLDAYERDRLPHLAVGTQYNYHCLFVRWRQSMGTVALTDLTPAYLQRWCQSLGQHYAPSTVRRYLYALSAALALAVKPYHWLPANPMEEICYPPDAPGRTRFLTEPERNALLVQCRLSGNPHLYLVVLLALTTGARKNELLWLRWGDVDLERGLLALLRTKNKDSRAVPVTGLALERLRQRAALVLPDHWVFPRADGQKPLLIDQAWQVARRRAHLKDFRFHDLRHTAASWLARSGATLRDIAEILGHRSIKQTMRYSHLTIGHTTEVMRKMTDKYLS